MLTIQQLSMDFGSKILFKNVSIQFNLDNRYGLIGANGSGKSTFLKILTGEIIPESGQIHLPYQLTIGTLKQNHYLFENQLIIDIVMQGHKILWNALATKKILMQSDKQLTKQQCEELEQLEKAIENHQGYAAEGEAAKLLEGLGITKSLHYQPLSVLSGGYKLRVLLAQVFFSKPNILVLDEPTNHLDLYSIKWLARYLKSFKGIVIVTSHDREFLNEVCTHIADIDYETIQIYKGQYNEFLTQKQQSLEQKHHLLTKQVRQTEHLKEFIDRFQAKATKARQAQSKMRVVEKLEQRIENLDLKPSSHLTPHFQFISARDSAIKVLEIKDLQKSYHTKKVLNQVSFTIEKGQRVAIIGPNGIGKSTLLEIVMQSIAADQGHFQWGHATNVAYFPQDHAKEVQQGVNLLDWLGKFNQEVSQAQLRYILGQVLFSKERVELDVHSLSGGETARLLLAKIMLLKPNVIVLDEPTNHLDIETIDALLNALQLFKGTLIFVSHNRHFVSNLANHIIEISYDGVQQYQGTYQEYLNKKEKDYLSNPVSLNQRYKDTNASLTKDAQKTSYHEQKQLKALKIQLKKKMQQKEEKCQQLDQKIHQFNTLFSNENFYQVTCRDQQLIMAEQKKQLENQLFKAMEEWQQAIIEWEAYQE